MDRRTDAQREGETDVKVEIEIKMQQYSFLLIKSFIKSKAK